MTEADKIFIKRGIALRTFVFTAVLITLTIVISFGVLYFILPDFYYYIKNKNLETNAMLLVEKIERGSTNDAIRQEIMEFSNNNNANILTFADKNGLIVLLSTPFSSFYSRGGDFQWASETTRVEIKQAEAGEQHSILSDIIYFDERMQIAAPSMSIIQAGGVVEHTNTAAARINGASIISFNFKLNHDFIDHMIVTSTLQPINEAQTVIISLAPYLLIVNILIALIAAYFYSKHMTKPIVALSAAAAKMRLMTPDVISAIRTNDELGVLSENLDLMYVSLCSNIEDLRQEMEKVSVLEKSKTDFMRAASHELKTPIAALNGIIEGMIDNVGKYKDKEKYLNESKKLIDSLAKLIGEILRASKMDATESIVQKESFNLSELIESTLDGYRLFIEEKGIELTFEHSEMYVTTDPNMLRNALSNVISNAVNYTKDGGMIFIEMNTAEDGYVLSVENECGSIPDSDLSKLFEPFYTRSYSRNRIYSGTGLGLYIVKRNLETLHLKYRLENSELGLKFNIYFKNQEEY